MVRLQKYISDCGYTSRRKAEELIEKGEVTVNGKVAEIGDKIDEENSIVKIKGKIIRPNKAKAYIMLNKPKGYLSTVTDDRGRRTVIDLLSGVKERVFPVGRLDYDTEGLLILTNDGEFTYKVTHPKHNIKKTYIATVSKKPTDESLKMLENGVEIEDYIAKADYIKIKTSSDKETEVKITISQGKNRQVRKMFDAIGHKVIKLKRISVGNLIMDDLKSGEWRRLKKEEIKKILD